MCAKLVEFGDDYVVARVRAFGEKQASVRAEMFTRGVTDKEVTVSSVEKVPFEFPGMDSYHVKLSV